MKRFVELCVLLVSVGIFGACGSKTNQLDDNALKAESQVLDYVNDINKTVREEEHGSSFEGQLTEKNVTEVYYSGKDLNEYIFVTKEQLYNDPKLKEEDRIYVGHYYYKKGSADVVSEKKFEKLVKDKTNQFEKIYEADGI